MFTVKYDGQKFGQKLQTESARVALKFAKALAKVRRLRVEVWAGGWVRIAVFDGRK